MIGRTNKFGWDLNDDRVRLTTEVHILRLAEC